MTEGIQEDMKTELISVIIPVYKVEKYINGGHQERNQRAGTENVAGIVGLGSELS